MAPYDSFLLHRLHLLSHMTKIFKKIKIDKLCKVCKRCLWKISFSIWHNQIIILILISTPSPQITPKKKLKMCACTFLSFINKNSPNFFAIKLIKNHCQFVLRLSLLFVCVKIFNIFNQKKKKRKIFL